MTGLYGGAFDPPHVGHVAVARSAKEHFDLPRLIVLVVGAPGSQGDASAARVRLELARAAFPDDEVRLDPYPRTIDLLRAEQFDDPLFIVGADEFCDFLSWKEPNGVLELARLAVATRPGFPRERLDAVLERLDAARSASSSSRSSRIPPPHGISGRSPPPVRPSTGSSRTPWTT